MSTDLKDRGQTERRLWDGIEHNNTGMLGLTGGGSHFQPMTAFLDAENGRIWFFTRDDSDLVQDLGDGAEAMYIHQQKDVQACIRGELRPDLDQARVEKYWNAVVAAWYPDGKSDRHLRLLRLDCADAQVWISDAGPLKFAWEIAKANATGQTPDIGGSTHLNLQ